MEKFEFSRVTRDLKVIEIIEVLEVLEEQEYTFESVFSIYTNQALHQDLRESMLCKKNN